MTKSELKYPIETHARNPKETHVALRRRASALSVARVRLYWVWPLKGQKLHNLLFFTDIKGINRYIKYCMNHL